MEQPNLNYIRKLSGGDTDFEKQLFEVLKKEFPIERELFKNSIESDQFYEAAEIVHKLKHKFSILGLEKGYQTVLNNISAYLNEL